MKANVGYEFNEVRDERLRERHHAFQLPEVLRAGPTRHAFVGGATKIEGETGHAPRKEGVPTLAELSPAVQEAAQKLAARILRDNPITPAILEKFFVTDSGFITEADKAYFAQYLRFVVPQLVVGAFLGPNENYADKSESELVTAMNAGASKLIFPHSLIYHDVIHSVVAMYRSNDKTDYRSLTPNFQKSSTKEKDYPDRSAHKKAQDARENDEILVDLWDHTYYSREKMVDRIRDAKNKKRFVSYFHVSGKDPLAIQLLERVYKDYEQNPRFLFDLFVEITTPFMEKHAPEATALLKNSKR